MTVSPEVKNAIATASSVTHVAEPILAAFAHIESRSNVNTKSSKTEVRGLFQIQGSTWRNIWKEQGQLNKPYSIDATEQAITAGYLISSLAKRYNNNFNLVAIAYNAGPPVADALIGKELNQKNVHRAVVGYFRVKGVDLEEKAIEVYNYPKKFMAALGGTFTPSGSSFTGSEAITNVLPNPIAIIDPNQSFFVNLMSNSSESINRFSGIISKLDQMTLRKRIAGSKRLQKLINIQIPAGSMRDK